MEQRPDCSYVAVADDRASRTIGVVTLKGPLSEPRAAGFSGASAHILTKRELAKLWILSAVARLAALRLAFLDVRNFQILFDDAEPSHIQHPAFAPYGQLGFPAAHNERPWTYANFVQSIDGVASFKGPHAAGSDISQSAEDRWLMDLLRAHADAIITGIHTLVEETLSAPKLNEGRGPVYRIEEESLRDLRAKLGRKREKVIFVTASGGVDPRAYRVFDGDQMDALILTTKAGAARLQGKDYPGARDHCRPG